MNQPQPFEPPRTAPSTDRRRLKTETSASGGWAARLQAVIKDRDERRPPTPQRPSTSP